MVNKTTLHFILIFLFSCIGLGCAMNKHKIVKGEGVIVFMGDSITQGWTALMPDFFSGRNYINKGIGGQTTSQMRARFNTDVLAFQPHAVVLLGGTNDIAGLGGDIPVDSIFRNIAGMAFLARRHDVKVILCSVIPAYEYACCKSIKPVPLIAELNEKLKSFAEKEGFLYVDYFKVLSDKKRGFRTELTSDGVHPNKAGYEIMSPLLLKAISKIYKR